MQFFRKIFTKNIYFFLNLSKETLIAVFIIFIPISYSFSPKTAEAGLFSFIFDSTVDKVSAKTLESQPVADSQNMPILKAVVNSNPNPILAGEDHILPSENVLLAEIGPSGTIGEIEEAANTQISLYVVRSGDTLSEIALMFGVSVNTIVWANNLGSKPVIRQGQNLIILPITGIRHVVKKGDTIKGIVAKYEANLDEVLQYNGLSVDSPIAVGDIIIVPDAELSAADSPPPPKSRPSNPSYAGYYLRPIVGGKKTQGIHGHNGVDLAAPVGTPIYASAGGTVIANMANGGWNGGYGNYVIISHQNGTQTVYAHNSVNLVTVGQKVAKGDLIGKIGMTGKTTGPHVHFEIRGAVNPF